ncbi:MAG TPA: Asp-tRNA(Asn)/Glu-tRNA(Gln) amidotransferase subunit GatB [Lacipirellulaceae bacterium]|jgi:aspartyl-tRNA(Asn)/glutamyl-tRNA(Gln) amidotransferase subunit B|nr:Asp-tRNA(Asn)/Glu-tRNA(Gln) amidotransferase subunit GatB [Lacipirellulaceae bacterium]
MSEYSTIIGLEVHVQLATASKLFCGCSTKFGAEPNTQTCPVCIGLPGTLPVMNRSAFQLALKTAIAVNCEIPAYTKWDRKQYYYPDLPKNYQISQYDLPMSQHGYLEISDPKGAFEPKRVRILRAHLEEDAGKSLHDEVAGKGDSLIDLNRTGTPLLEIVSEPDMRSSLEAKTFLTELRLLLTYIGVSDCNMQEGSLRVDANVNLHIDTPDGEIATPIIEIKNMNSFRAVERAIDYEAQRQWTEWQETHRKKGDAPKQTRGWDDVAGVTRAQRSKEESSDYRYFPDPDLAPVTTTAAEVDSIRQSLGELPAGFRSRLQTEFGLSAYNADVLINQGHAVVAYFLEVAQSTGDPKAAANWVTQDVLRTLKESNGTIEAFSVTSAALADLIRKIKSGDVPSPRAREVFQTMVEKRFDAAEALKMLGIAAVDESELVALCQTLLAANPKTITDVRAGKVQAVGALIGQAKKQNPNVDPTRFREICLQLIEAAP